MNAPAVLSLPGSHTNVTYKLPEGMSFDEWAEAGRQLQQVAVSVPFWFADWFIYGEEKFSHEDMYLQAIEATGNRIKTFQNWISVARKIPPAQRIESASFSAHRAVVSIEDAAARKAILEAAQRTGASSRALEDAVKDYKAALSPRGEPAAADPAPCAPEPEPEEPEVIAPPPAEPPPTGLRGVVDAIAALPHPETFRDSFDPGVSVAELAGAIRKLQQIRNVTDAADTPAPPPPATAKPAAPVPDFGSGPDPFDLGDMDRTRYTPEQIAENLRDRKSENA